MGIYKEVKVSELVIIQDIEKTGFSKNLQKKRFPPRLPVCNKGFSKNLQKKRFPPRLPVCNKERYIIVALLLVIIALIVTVIILSITASSTFSNLNNEERKDNPSPSPPNDVTAIKNQNSAPCEDDWIWYRGKCYYFSTEHDTWRNSQSYCNSHNASLALIDNKKEHDFLFQFKGSDNRWIGLGRTADNTAWTWANGTSYNENLFTITRSSHDNIEYAYLNHNGVNSREGTFELKWICNRGKEMVNRVGNQS
ncbi:natural killer cells antigen CD94-like isoform X2 [Rhinoderma darwinii]|uniref:natural killer cells antigen CD94-like isoform X2 n=1 Tax=Rhinoderma darwinii TaxID=43563 RepID=UPI003F6707AC